MASLDGREAFIVSESGASRPSTRPSNGRLEAPVLHLDVSLRGLVFGVALLLGLYLALRLWPILVLVLFALILTAALLPVMNWLMAHGLPRTLAMVVTIATPLLVLIALMPLAAPPLLEEFRNIDRNLPRYAREADGFLTGWGINADLEGRAQLVDLGSLSSGSVHMVREPVLVGGFGVITVIVLTGYLLMDLPRLSRFVYQFVPHGREAEVEMLAGSLRKVVGGYVRGQAITSAAIGTFTFVVLLAVGAPAPLAFAVIAAIADIIPLIGGFIAVIPAVVATLGVSTERALVVLVCLVLYQQFEDRVLVPRVYGSTMNLPPLVVFVVVLAGAQLLGVIGILLALPAAAAVRVLLEYTARHRELVPLTAPHSDLFAPDEPAAASAAASAPASAARSTEARTEMEVGR